MRTYNLAWCESELDKALDNLLDMVNQHCSVCDEKGDKLYDSMFISSNADAMRFLAAHGRIEILSDVGKEVIANPYPDEPKETNDEP